MKAYPDTRSPKLSRFLCLFASALLLGALAHADIPKPDRYPSPARFDSRIKLFTTQDKAIPPVQGGIVFAGSSTITNWNKNLGKDFPEMGAIGRGFGGSNIADNTFYADKTVLPHKPRQIVFYAGENDIAEKRTPEGVLEDFQGFVAKVRSELPTTPILYLSIKPSPRRWKMQEQFNEANALIKDFCESQENIQFLDIRPALLDANGEPRPELYVEDKLHLNAEGYAILRQAVAPHLIAAPAAVTETATPADPDGGQTLTDNAGKSQNKGKKEGKGKKADTDTAVDPDGIDTGGDAPKGKKSEKSSLDDTQKNKKDNTNKKDDKKNKKDKDDDKKDNSKKDKKDKKDKDDDKKDKKDKDKDKNKKKKKKDD